jgi:hypothetical protein
MLAQTNDRAVFAADSHESNVSTPEAQRADGVDPQKKR